MGIIGSKFTLQLPAGAQILTVQTQSGEAHLWALVEPGAPMRERAFYVYGTGWDINETGLTYIGTYQVAGGHGVCGVFHLFEDRIPILWEVGIPDPSLYIRAPIDPERAIPL